ncbi:hypothetical protein JHL18_25055 [Clostridium sp. YIM B02505]|uniref:AlgX/AlgJ SGNH hydrolase-like domain-containing protein n=1 Tax=Clostridium yunnanense TaxID=2800325 RepID=A0ABS1EWW7_9CLOT|nr:hypothetical protein [Clostridium yunnanense]MBK1813879.1 hypothetical protein [Clostridium yunnanense]
MKKKQQVFISAFIIALLAPNILFFFLKNHVDTRNFQNKKLSEKPTFSLQNISKYPRQYEEYYDDHIAFKNQFVELNDIINLKFFHILSSKNVLLGSNNWLFYDNKDDGDPISDYEGSNLYTDHQLELIGNRLEKAESYFKAKNIKLVLFLAPDKENVYSEYMPKNIKVLSKITIADQTAKYISEHTDVPLVYPKSELLETKKQYQVYYKYDTHWNKIGGFIGSQQLSDKLTGNRSYLNDVKISDANKCSGDLANMINLNSYLNDDKMYSISKYREDVKVDLVKKTDDEFYIKYESNASDKRKILIIRDSYSEAMFDYIPKDFASTVFIHAKAFKPSDIEREKPDIVVYESVERYIEHLEGLTLYDGM